MKNVVCAQHRVLLVQMASESVPCQLAAMSARNVFKQAIKSLQAHHYYRQGGHHNLIWSLHHNGTAALARN